MARENNPLEFPDREDRDRIAQYDFYDKLYNGDHFEAFSIRGEDDFSGAYNKLRYVVPNFAGLISRVVADMLFGEKITIDFDDENTQKFADGLIEDNQLINQLYESALANSRRGDSVFKLRVGQRNPFILTQPSSIIAEEVSPSIYFPEFDQNSPRYTPNQDMIAWTFQQAGNTYLHKEIHVPGYIYHEIYNYNPNSRKIINKVDQGLFGFDEIEETGIERSLVFHVPNFRDGNGFWGTSDYQGLTSLFFAINNRLTKTDNILDKHSDPILAVPPGVLDEDGSIRKEALGMFEVANDTPGFNKPEYIVWNANLESAEKEIDSLVDLLFTMAEVSPTAVGRDDKGGGRAESGRALKFRLLSAIRKRNRKIRYYDFAIKDMLKVSIELANAHLLKAGDVKPGDPDRPTIDWGDGVLNDIVEQTEVEIKRVDAGLSSRADSIARLDGLTPDEAKDKVKEIDEESVLDMKNNPLLNAAAGAGISPDGSVSKPKASEPVGSDDDKTPKVASAKTASR